MVARRRSPGPIARLLVVLVVLLTAATAVASPVAAAPPEAPGVPVATPGDGQVELAWGEPADGGADITGYDVQYRESGGSWPGTQVAVGGTSTTISGLSNGTAYEFRVRAKNAVGDGPFSGVASATPRTAPSAPSVGFGDVTDSAIEVTWMPGAENGATVSGFTVTLSPGGQSASKGLSDRAHTFTGLEPGTTYTATVTVNSNAGSSEAQASTTTAVREPTAPGAVVATNVVPFGRTVLVTWTPPAVLGGGAISGYEITLGPETRSVAGTVRSVQIGGLPAGRHTPRVVAVNAGGESPAGTGVAVEVRAFAPFASADGFVRQQYRDFLGRNADAGGLAYWRNRLGGNLDNVDDVVIAFMRSPEFSPRRKVARLYFAYFNRTPDLSGFDYWSGRLRAGTADLDDVSQFFAISPEFGRTYGGLSDGQFVVLVYNNVLRRRPDNSGYQYWLTELQNGMPRGRLMTLFSESPEYREASRPGVDVVVTYRGMLNRRPDTEGFRFWVGRVTFSDNSLADLIQGFYVSAEYASRVRP